MSFPKFPNFRKLVPQDRAAYNAFYVRVEPYSDFSFNNLIIWLDLHDDLEISQYQKCLVLRFTNPFEKTTTKAYTLIGFTNCLKAIEAIFSYQEARNETATLTMVPECVISNVLHTHDLTQRLVVRASSDHRDYIFDSADVVALEGGAMLNLRRNIHVFEREHPSGISMELFDLGNAHHQAQLTRALEMWGQDNDFFKNDPDLDEAKALRRYMKFNEWCPAECRCFFIDGTLFGFSIVQKPPQKGWAIFNHLRATRAVPHAYDFIYYETVKELYAQSITMINFEQDLGIPGLRIHKKQLGRSTFLYRYEASRL